MNRLDVLRLIQKSDDEDVARSSKFQQALRKSLDKYIVNLRKSQDQAYVKARYPWSPEKYKEFKATPIETLVDDKYFFGLKERIYPVHREEVITIFKLWRDKKIEEAVEISAIGVGKSFKMALFAGLFAFDVLIEPHPAALFGLDEKSKLAVLVGNRNATLAKEVTFPAIMTMMDVPFFRDYFPMQIDPRIVEEIRKYPSTLRFPKKFTFFPGTSLPTSMLGHNVVLALQDEFAWGEKATGSKRAIFGFGNVWDASYEMYQAAQTRVFSRTYGGERTGFFLGITSPRSIHDFAEKLYKEGLKNKRLIDSGKDLDVERDKAMFRDPTPEEKEMGIKNKIFDFEAAAELTAKKTYSLERKPMWRARPQIWKGTKYFSGMWLPFDTKSLHFTSNQVQTDLFENKDDFTPEGYLKVPTELVKRFQDNPERSLRDLAAVATAGMNRFFGDLMKITFKKELVNYTYLDRAGVITLRKQFNKDNKHLDKPEAKRYGHGDLAKNRDCAGIAACHLYDWKVSTDRKIKKPIAMFDLLHEVYPRHNERDIRLSDVEEIIINIEKEGGLKIGVWTFDGWQSLRTIQTLWNDYDIPAENLSIDHTTSRILESDVHKGGNYGCYKEGVTNQPIASWIAFREAWYEGRILCPMYEREECSLSQMVEQEEFFADAKAGKGQVDHPPGGKHDLLQAMVGAYWNLMNNEWWVYSYEIESDDSRSEMERIEGLDQTIIEAKLTDEDLRKMGLG